MMLQWKNTDRLALDPVCLLSCFSYSLLPPFLPLHSHPSVCRSQVLSFKAASNVNFFMNTERSAHHVSIQIDLYAHLLPHTTSFWRQGLDAKGSQHKARKETLSISLLWAKGPLPCSATQYLRNPHPCSPDEILFCYCCHSGIYSLQKVYKHLQSRDAKNVEHSTSWFPW